VRGRVIAAVLGGALAMMALAACGGSDANGPPTVHYDDSVCARCGMILSDERFAAATIVADDRGEPMPLLFDDSNCQAGHEKDKPGLAIIARWVHDHGTREWIDARRALFVYSPELRTPMASHVAAFGTLDAARKAAENLGGRVVSFEELWAVGSFDDLRQDEPDEKPEGGEQGGTP